MPTVPKLHTMRISLSTPYLIFLILLGTNHKVTAFVRRPELRRIGNDLPRTNKVTCNVVVLEPLHLVDSVVSSNSVLLAETEAWVQPAATFLDPFLNLMSFAMLTRVVLSWYPTTNVKELPWILVVLPTEPLLRAVRGVVPPAFGVDITPIVWLGMFTFIHEILLGQQGLLTLKLKYGI